MIQVVLDGHDRCNFGSWEEAEAFAQSVFPDCDFAMSPNPSSIDVFANSDWFDDRTQTQTQWPVGRLTEIEGF